MKTATVRQVRHEFGRVLQWVANGEQVEVTKRGEVVAHLLPARPQRKRFTVPDFKAMQRKVLGDTKARKLSTEDSAALRENMRGER